MFKDKMKAAVSQYAPNKDMLKDIVLEQMSSPAVKTGTFKLRYILTSCLALVLIAAAGGVAIVAEAAEYNRAVEFFEENGLSTEGLSRNELKTVYKDISQKTFSSKITADVLNDASVKTYRIELEDHDCDSLREWWEKYWADMQNEDRETVANNGNISFKIITDENSQERSLIRYVDGNTDWSVKITHDGEYFVETVSYIHNGGVIVVGSDHIDPEEKGVISYSVYRIHYFDSNGNLKWSKKYSSSTQSLVTHYENGQLYAFTIDNNSTLLHTAYEDTTLVKIDASSGNQLFKKKTESEFTDSNYYGLMRLDGKFALVRRGRTSSTNKFCIEYISDDGQYLAQTDLSELYDLDIIMYEGRIYIGASVTPKEPAEIDVSLMIAHTPVPAKGLRDAVLYVLDPDGTLKEAYYVKDASIRPELSKSSNGVLYINDNGQLCWDIAAFTGNITFYPDANSFSFIADITSYELTFGKNGEFISQKAIWSGSTRGLHY